MGIRKKKEAPPAPTPNRYDEQVEKKGPVPLVVGYHPEGSICSEKLLQFGQADAKWCFRQINGENMLEVYTERDGGKQTLCQIKQAQVSYVVTDQWFFRDSSYKRA